MAKEQTKIIGMIWTKLCLGPRSNPFNFGEDPDYDPEPLPDPLLHNHCRPMRFAVSDWLSCLTFIAYFKKKNRSALKQGSTVMENHVRSKNTIQALKSHGK